jgi:hypothetical protein
MGRRKRDGNYSPLKNNLIEDSEGNKVPVADSNKTKINDTKEPKIHTKTTSKKKSCK